jgi:hypothetical protein
MCISGYFVLKHNGGRIFEELINKEEDRIKEGRMANMSSEIEECIRKKVGQIFFQSFVL